MSFDEQLYAALVDGYDISELGRMLRLGVSKDLESITDAKNLKDAVFEVIKASIRGGWTHTLLSAAKEYNNGNDLIKALPLVPPIETLELYPRPVHQENQEMRSVSSRNDSTGRIDLTNGELAKQVIENKFAVNALTSQFTRMELKLDKLTEKFQQAYGMTVVNAAPPAATQNDYRIILAAVIVGVFVFAGLYLGGGV